MSRRGCICPSQYILLGFGKTEYLEATSFFIRRSRACRSTCLASDVYCLIIFDRRSWTVHFSLFCLPESRALRLEKLGNMGKLSRGESSTYPETPSNFYKCLSKKNISFCCCLSIIFSNVYTSLKFFKLLFNSCYLCDMQQVFKAPIIFKSTHERSYTQQFTPVG